MKSLFVAMCVLIASVAFGEKKKPNIVFILADDLGVGELGCYGQTKIQTPNIDRLAKEGMKFSQAYSPSPVCAPTRCGLLTGMTMGHA
jgi:arylsulfatase A-like enzyme